MGQKVNPHGLRVGVIKDWDSRWYAESDFADYLVAVSYTHLWNVPAIEEKKVATYNAKKRNIFI